MSLEALFPDGGYYTTSASVTTAQYSSPILRDDTINVTPFWSKRSHEQMRSIRSLTKLIKRRLTPKQDGKDGIVYVLQAKESEHVKVGFTTKDDLSRIEHITRHCDIEVCNKYSTEAFRGAFRAEQILHKLLKPWGYNRYSCFCGVKANTEWVKRPFAQVVVVVQMVYSWFHNQAPYDMDGQDFVLQPKWKEALVRWEASQESREPLEWIAFFLLDGRYMNGRELFARKSATPATVNIATASASKGGMCSLTMSSEARQRLTDRRTTSQKRRLQQGLAAAIIEPTPTRHGNQTAATITNDTDVSPSHDIELQDPITTNVNRRLFPGITSLESTVRFTDDVDSEVDGSSELDTVYSVSDTGNSEYDEDTLTHSRFVDDTSPEINVQRSDLFAPAYTPNITVETAKQEEALLQSSQPVDIPGAFPNSDDEDNTEWKYEEDHDEEASPVHSPSPNAEMVEQRSVKRPSLKPGYYYSVQGLLSGRTRTFSNPLLLSSDDVRAGHRRAASAQGLMRS